MTPLPLHCPQRQSPNLMKQTNSALITKRHQMNESLNYIPRSKPAKLQCFFMLLALELRQQIYEYVYDEDIRLEILPRRLNSRFLKPAPPVPVLDLSKHRSDRAVKRRRYPKPEGYIADLDYTITKLYLVNRQLHVECLEYLYRRLHLFAQSCTALRRLFRITPKPYLHAIRTVNLYHVAYGHPELLSHEVWKQEADAAWARTLDAFVTHMPNVRRLRISLEVRDVPFILHASASWAKPLRVLSDLPFLESVAIRVGSSMLRNQRLFLRRYERGELTAAARNYVVSLRIEHGDCLVQHEDVGAEIARQIVAREDGVVWDHERSERWRALPLNR